MSFLRVIHFEFLSTLGRCVRINDTDYRCVCKQERTGTHCEILVHYCRDGLCFNKGVCRPLPLSYKCECLSNDYWGDHCEHVATSIIVRKYISRGFAFIAIIALATVAGFVIIMDALKYLFGIDPVRRERDQIRRGRALLERRKRRKRKKRKRKEIHCC